MPVAARKQLQIDDPDLFMDMEDLELAAHGIVEGTLHGLHRSPYLGFSVEFDSHREYQRGDDLRYVNWNLWARTERLYIKQFKSDTNLNLYLLLDTTGSMFTAHGRSQKWRYGARAAAALAFLALLGRDATGAYMLGNTVQDIVPPRVRPGQFHEILALLQGVQSAGQGDIGAALEDVRETCKRRGIIVLISDLFDKEAEILHGLSDLRYMGHEVLVLHVLDPWEIELPTTGQYEFEDLESGEKLRVHAPQLRESYNRIVADWREGLKRSCEERGIDWLACGTHEPIRNLLIEYLLRRARY
ncbi:DUF58 domain-containing protein [Candidatus Sumerlaeota bacterium]|nr:DUF58 domain-containing protein [Candidatus Sumerlaeota bacterium]